MAPGGKVKDVTNCISSGTQKSFTDIVQGLEDKDIESGSTTPQGRTVDARDGCEAVSPRSKREDQAAGAEESAKGPRGDSSAATDSSSAGRQHASEGTAVAVEEGKVVVVKAAATVAGMGVRAKSSCAVMCLLRLLRCKACFSCSLFRERRGELCKQWWQPEVSMYDKVDIAPVAAAHDGLRKTSPRHTRCRAQKSRPLFN